MFFKKVIDQYCEFLRNKIQNISWPLLATISFLSAISVCVLAIVILFVTVEIVKDYGPWAACGIFIVWCFVEFFLFSLSVVSSNVAIEKSIDWGKKFFNKQN